MDEFRGPDDDAVSESVARPSRTIRERWSEFVADRWAAWHELRYAKRTSQRALACHQRLQSLSPELSGRALYEAFVCEFSGVETAAARTILRRAEDSFAAWPNDRDLIFRDVVQYVAILEYLASHPKRGGTTANMMSAISNTISDRL